MTRPRLPLLIAAALATAAESPAAAPAEVSLAVAPLHGPALAARAPFRMTLRVTAHTPFPAPGQSLRVELPHYHAYEGPSVPQTDRPQAPGYTCLTLAPTGAFLRVLEPRLAPVVVVTAGAGFDLVLPRPLEPGQSLEAVYGWGLPGAALAGELAVDPAVPGYKPFLCRLLEPDGAPGPVLAQASPPILATAAMKLSAVAPAVVRPGLPFPLRLVALDPWGNRAESFRGTLTVDAPNGPVPIAFGASERGVAVTTLTAPVTPTVLRLAVRGPGQLAGRSNPVIVSAKEEGVFFGDLHIHSGDASIDAYGSFQDAYVFARDVGGLGFAAKTDHDGELPEPLWQRSREAASRAGVPGRFVAFLGFEWTPARSWGHRTVLFSGLEGAVVPCGSARGATPGQLWRALEQYPCLGIPHHPSSEPIEHHRFDWSSHVPSQEPLVEIFSQWNRSKEQLMGMDSETNPNGVQAALVSGKRLGFVGGSDSHTAMGGRTGGLAALRAPSLDRDSLWRALMNRRTYATTGARILLTVRVADEPPDPGLAIEVHATAPVTRLEVVKGWPGAPIPLGAFTVPIPRDSEDITVLWRDPAPVRDSFYYARVLQSDGARAWSSPVWVSLPEARAPASDTIEWMKLPLGSGWSAGALESPAPAIPALTLLPDGVEVRTPAIPWITREPRRRVSYFHARLGPLPFVEGRRYRVQGTLRAERPTIAILHTLDDRTRNPGLFCAVELKGPGHKASIQRSFDARLTTGASLHLFLPVGDNRVRLSELSIEEARAAR